jgi:hypothetical protein
VEMLLRVLAKGAGGLSVLVALAGLLTGCSIDGGASSEQETLAARSAHACAAPYEDCDGIVAKGCETNTATSVEHCGQCSSPCSVNHGTPSCEQGICKIACAQGYDNCDGNGLNGCETDLNTSVQACGSCSTKCTNANGTTQCVQGVCTPTCGAAYYKDCDLNPNNGCEANVNSSVTNCGTCGHACTNPHGAVSCAAGICALTCSAP